MLKRLQHFLNARDGLAAVEFALIAPVMILLFFGALEFAMAIDCKTRVNNVAATTADLVAQSPSISSSDAANIFSAANSILYPYVAANAKIVVSSLVDNGKGAATVAWSEAQNTAKRAQGATVAVPAGLIVSGSGGSVILAEISYAYTPPTLVVLTGTLNMTGSFYSKPRRSLTVTHS
jgi:Flp pilus assembly protein TadG